MHYLNFVINKLLSTVQAYIPEIISLQTYFIHFVNENEPLNENEQAQLEVLLNSRILMVLFHKNQVVN